MDDLNQIFARHCLEPPRMRPSRDGETLLVGGYTAPVDTRRKTVRQRLLPGQGTETVTSRAWPTAGFEEPPPGHPP
ncbi:hypothetical protein [Streptomyces sp. NPDC001851]|uniref:hypothetical protein n=1 Tax=Streptomyces sp. NPDC001851 TaxID=3154529 RepID=UPI00332C5B06